eukprot:IDg6177t1
MATSVYLVFVLLAICALAGTAAAEPKCSEQGGKCKISGDCCHRSLQCTNGGTSRPKRCRACIPSGGRCTRAIDCCNKSQACHRAVRERMEARGVAAREGVRSQVAAARSAALQSFTVAHCSAGSFCNCGQFLVVIRKINIPSRKRKIGSRMSLLLIDVEDT